MTLPWSVSDLADAIEAGLCREAARLDEETAVCGLDARDELELHPVLAAALEASGYGVHREQQYPADRARRRGNEGERCDLVLTPEHRQLVVPEVRTTLFEPADAVHPEDAFWLEVKVVAQHTIEGANHNYTAQLLSPVRHDVTKLSKDRHILHAGLLVILFVASAEIADHDLGVWLDRCIRRGLPVAAPARRDIGITDRLGNTVCAVALYPVHHL